MERWAARERMNSSCRRRILRSSPLVRKAGCRGILVGFNVLALEAWGFGATGLDDDGGRVLGLDLGQQPLDFALRKDFAPNRLQPRESPRWVIQSPAPGTTPLTWRRRPRSRTRRPPDPPRSNLPGHPFGGEDTPVAAGSASAANGIPTGGLRPARRRLGRGLTGGRKDAPPRRLGGRQGLCPRPRRAGPDQRTPNWWAGLRRPHPGSTAQARSPRSRRERPPARRCAAAVPSGRLGLALAIDQGEVADTLIQQDGEVGEVDFLDQGTPQDIVAAGEQLAANDIPAHRVSPGPRWFSRLAGCWPYLLSWASFCAMREAKSEASPMSTMVVSRFTAIPWCLRR